MLIEILGDKTDFVVPINRERIQSKIFEISLVLKFLTDAFVIQLREIKSLDFASVESKFESIARNILCRSDVNQFYISFLLIFNALRHLSVILQRWNISHSLRTMCNLLNYIIHMNCLTQKFKPYRVFLRNGLFVTICDDLRPIGNR